MSYRPAGLSDDDEFDDDDDDDYMYRRNRRQTVIPSNGNQIKSIQHIIFDRDEAALRKWILNRQTKGLSINYDEANKVYPLISACITPWPEGVSLLLESGANPNVEDALMSALSVCCSAGATSNAKNVTECATLLVNNGANPNHRDHRGRVPLMLAVMENLEPVVELLLKNPDIDLTAKDPLGWTALFYGMKFSSGEIVEKLLAAGVNADVKARDGSKAADHKLEDEEPLDERKVSILFEEPPSPTPFSLENLQCGPGKYYVNKLLQRLPDAEGCGGYNDLAAEILNAANCSHRFSPDIQLPDLLCGDQEVLERAGFKFQYHRDNILKIVHDLHCAPWSESSVLMAVNVNEIGMEFVGQVVDGLLTHLVLINGTLQYLNFRIRKLPQNHPNMRDLVNSLVATHIALRQLKYRVKSLLGQINQVNSLKESPVDHVAKKLPKRSFSSKIAVCVFVLVISSYTYFSSVGSLVIGILLIFPQGIWAVLFALVLLAAVQLGLSATITTYLALSTRFMVRRCTPSAAFTEFHKYITESHQLESCRSPERLPVVFGRSVDIALQDLLDLVVRDLISPWLQDLAFSSRTLQQNIKGEIWFALGKLKERFADVDETKLIAVDIVTKITTHFERIRIGQLQASGANPGFFYLAHHLANRDKELNYLRKVSELLLVTLFPRSTVSPSINRSLLIEILTCKVFSPCIDLLTDPDYINQKLLEYVEQVQRNQDLHRNSYAHAESYVEFIQLIRASDNIDHLKHIRYTIMTEIMQATTIQNLKKAKGEKEDSSKKLRKYLSQLAYAKAHCENRLRTLDCQGFGGEGSAVTQRMDVPLETVLESVAGRKRLAQFLELSGEEALLAYWAAVEELRTTDKKNWHQIGAEIYYTFIHSPLSVIKVEKSVRRRIESFLLGDSGPDVFYEVEDIVVEKLRSEIYPSFLASDLYLHYLQDVDKDMQSNLSDDNPMFGEDEKQESVLEQTGYARTKLSQLDEKLNNKTQALQALRTSLKPESKVLFGLEKEVENLVGEKRQLEAHLTRTEVWGEHLGKWRATVQSVEIPEDKEPQFVLVVHVMEDEKDTESISTGWVVLRKLAEFQDLHRKLCQLWSGAKQLELPSQSPKFIFGKQLDKTSCEKAKAQVQKYLESVLKDERLNACEAIYSFLCPSSEHLKHSLGGSGLSSPKKTRFSFSTLFKTSNPTVGSDGSRESDEEDGSLLDETSALAAGEARDAVAEPLYALLGEVFDLRGVFRWLRKTLIAFVQVTYGRTISRQVGETVGWVLSEQMVHYYIQLFTQAWWPNGTLARTSSQRNFEDKLKTREDARSAVSNNTPEVLNNLVGLQNARRGSLKVFETLQDVRLNKQLFYEIFELIIYEVFPELQRKHAKRTKM